MKRDKRWRGKRWENDLREDESGVPGKWEVLKGLMLEIRGVERGSMLEMLIPSIENTVVNSEDELFRVEHEIWCNVNDSSCT